MGFRLVSPLLPSLDLHTPGDACECYTARNLLRGRCLHQGVLPPIQGHCRMICQQACGLKVCGQAGKLSLQALEA